MGTLWLILWWSRYISEKSILNMISWFRCSIIFQWNLSFFIWSLCLSHFPELFNSSLWTIWTSFWIVSLTVCFYSFHFFSFLQRYEILFTMTSLYHFIIEIGNLRYWFYHNICCLVLVSISNVNTHFPLSNTCINSGSNWILNQSWTIESFGMDHKCIKFATIT